MINKTIIADAGPLIAFGRIKHLSLLSETLGKIIVPQSVINECLFNMSLPGAKEIAGALKKKLISSHEKLGPHEYHHLFDTLGLGEATAIILATQLNCGLLIDEKLGRKTAQKMNVRIIGTAGVLLLAKEKKLIKKITPLINELKTSGYYLSKELTKTILKRANEK